MNAAATATRSAPAIQSSTLRMMDSIHCKLDFMAVDSKFLAEHYASLSDEAFEEIDPADLVEAARQCYDAEKRRRHVPDVSHQRDAAEIDESFEVELDEGADGKPAWLGDAACAVSYPVYRRLEPAEGVTLASEALAGAGIPCYEDFREVPPSRAPE